MPSQTKAKPYKFAEWLLSRLLFKEEREEKLGDFSEVFQHKASRGGVRKARL